MESLKRVALFIYRKGVDGVVNQNQMLADIRERIVRVETKLDSMTDVRSIAEQAKNTAAEAHASTRSAHKRLDKIDKVNFWLGTTVIGAVILALLNLILKG